MIEGQVNREITDDIIVELFFERSEKAIEKCRRKYEKLAMSISYNILHNREDAEECVSDAVLGLWNSIPPNRPRSLSAYFCTLVRNISLTRFDYNHASKRNSDMDLIFEELEGVISTSDWQSELDEGEITNVINDFLKGLKKRDRIMFVRRYYFSDPIKDIAELCGESEGAVSMRLLRLRRSLRSKLEKEGICI
ncbi:MAG: sigma-70 family RNA polymerase sigma factor [Clostridia bacterium]|nr:sigma-70 family RNA polymerase sigma factor [Clostridia bacterium]